jgi:uncharacterized protein
VLPALDLGVTRFMPRPGVLAPQYYLDMLTVEQTPETQQSAAWITADLYLDVAVRAGGTPALLDSDEFAAALGAGHLSPDETTRALLSAERVINGLFEHGTLEAWLDALGIGLTWWTRSEEQPDG